MKKECGCSETGSRTCLLCFCWKQASIDAILCGLRRNISLLVLSGEKAYPAGSIVESILPPKQSGQRARRYSLGWSLDGGWGNGLSGISSSLRGCFLPTFVLLGWLCVSSDSSISTHRAGEGERAHFDWLDVRQQEPVAAAHLSVQLVLWKHRLTERLPGLYPQNSYKPLWDHCTSLECCQTSDAESPILIELFVIC